MIDKIETLQEKLEAKTACLTEAYEYVSLSEMPQFKSINFPAMEIALYAIVEDLSQKRPAGKKIKTFAEWSDKDIETIFYPICSKDDFRPAMQGVYFDNSLNLIVATDAHILTAFQDKSNKKRSGLFQLNKIVKNPTTEILLKFDAKFPDYLAVLPTSEPAKKREIDLCEFYAFLNQFPKFTRIGRKNGVDFIAFYAGIKIFEGLYNIEFLLKITKALLQAGEKTIRFDFWEKHKPAVLNGIDNMALIMPLYQNEDPNITRSYPIKY